MQVIWYNSIIAVYCDYYSNAPGNSAGIMNLVALLTVKHAKDRVIGQKFSALLKVRHILIYGKKGANYTDILNLGNVVSFWQFSVLIFLNLIGSYLSLLWH